MSQSPISRRVVLQGAGASALAMLLAACGGSSDLSSTSGPSDTTGTSGGPATTGPATAAEIDTFTVAFP